MTTRWRREDLLALRTTNGRGGIRTTAGARHNRNSIPGINDISGNKKHCRCSYFGSYYSLWQASGNIRTRRFGLPVSRCGRHTSGTLKAEFEDADRKLARQIADTLDDAAEMFSEQAITAFTEKIRDSKTKTQSLEIFADVFRSVSGREFGAGSLRAFADSGWPASSRNCRRDLIRNTIWQCGRSSVSSARQPIEITIGFGARDDVFILRFRDDLASRLSTASVDTSLKVVKQMFKAAAQRFKIESPAHFVSGVRKERRQKPSGVHSLCRAWPDSASRARQRMGRADFGRTLHRPTLV